MSSLYELSSAQLRQALHLREQIETLQGKLDSLLGSTTSSVKAPSEKVKRSAGRPKGRRTMSAAARAKIAAAARARWARQKSTAANTAKATATRKPKKTRKSGLTAEGRAKLAASMKARWAARKKAANASGSSAS